MMGEQENLKQMQSGIKSAFKAVKDEMNMHLETINQNTTEIQSIYECLDVIDSKIEKLNERIDSIQMLLAPEHSSANFEIELTNREQEVFLIIYSENACVCAKEIGKKLGFSDEMVNRYIYNMISKGVPLLRHYKDGEIIVSLDLKFRDLQAKKNILKIDESVSKQLLSDKAI
jgi:biotin operon repressor